MHGLQPDDGDGKPPPNKRRPCKLSENSSLHELTSRICISEEDKVLSVLSISEEEQLRLALKASRESAAAAAAARGGDSDPDWEVEEDEESSSGVSSDHSLAAGTAAISSISHNSNKCIITESGAMLEDWRQYLGCTDDVKCKLLLRYPKGEKEQIVLPATSRLKVGISCLLLHSIWTCT